MAVTFLQFRARKKSTGEWVIGNWIHNLRKGEFFAIRDFEFNETHEVYRESLQVMNASGNWVDVDEVLNCEPYTKESSDGQTT